MPRIELELILNVSTCSCSDDDDQKTPGIADFSRAVDGGMISYKGPTAPIKCDSLSCEASRGHYADGTDFHPGKIETVPNTGTYLDSLFHRYKNGEDLSELPLSYLAELPAVVVRCTRHSIGVEMFEGVNVTSEV